MNEKRYASVFEYKGMPPLGQAFPLALQHVVAMIVGCVTPAIMVSGTAGLENAEKVILIQASLVFSALSTFLMLFPIKIGKGFRIGAGLPVMVGVSFSYVLSMQTIASSYGIGAILGAQLVGGIVAVAVGLSIDRIRKFFPPLIAGTVVFTIGLSLYPTAINYMAGGTGSADYGAWQNWFISLLTLIIVTVLNHFTRGFIKLASILIAMACGYVVSAFMGMISFDAVAEASIFAPPVPLYFGIDFEPSACIAIGLLFAINSIQAIGDFSATTGGAMDRSPTNEELRGAITGYGIANIVSSFFGGLPTATYSQNVGIVTTTKVINRCVLGLAALIILIAGLSPKFSAILTTIPYAVLGGATVSVFASIAMTGIKLVMSDRPSARDTSIVGLAAALGMGISQASESLSTFPEWVTTIFGNSPVVIATIVAVFLNMTLPKDE